MNEEKPFIDVNEYNCECVKSITLRSLLALNEKYRLSMNKKRLVERYNDLYGKILTESQALFLVESICDYNSFVFDAEKWCSDYHRWIDLGKSFSIHFF